MQTWLFKSSLNKGTGLLRVQSHFMGGGTAMTRGLINIYPMGEYGWGRGCAAGVRKACDAMKLQQLIISIDLNTTVASFS